MKFYVGTKKIAPKFKNTFIKIQNKILAGLYSLEGFGWVTGNVANEVDIENKKFIKRVGKVVFDGSNDEQWASYGSVQRFEIGLDNFTATGTYDVANITCDKLTTVSKVIVASADNLISASDAGTSNIIVRINSTITSVALLKEYLANNPITIYYQLTTPSETDISYIWD